MDFVALKQEIISRVAPTDLMNYYGIEGSRFKYKCPFHNDRNPSMTVNNVLIRCWSCMGKSINVVDFVMMYENLQFTEAIKKLCDIGNIQYEDSNKSVKKINYKRLIKDLDKEINILHNFKKSDMVDIKALDLDIKELEAKKDAYVELLGRSDENWDF